MHKVEDIVTEIMAAEKSIRPFIRNTYLNYSPYLSKIGKAHVYCKMENLQYTGSFKLRGAMNKICTLSDQALNRGVVTASTGNHGAAVACGLQKLEADGIIFVPENADAEKVAFIKNYNAEVRFYGTDNAETEIHARSFATSHKMTYISPYNDPKVIGGQGTIGIELINQTKNIDAVFVALGGGGLISGIAAYLRSLVPEVQIIGCSPQNSHVMIHSIRAGRIMDIPSLPTISDGTAGGLEPGAITFELCRQLVNDYVTVNENEIKDALIAYMRNEHQYIEGAAAVAIAAYLKTCRSYQGKNVIIIICGANLGIQTFKNLILSDGRRDKNIL